MTWRSTDGFLARIFATIMVLLIVGSILVTGSVLTWLTVSHDALETIADHAALQLAAGGSPSTVLPGATEVGSESALQQCDRECYYIAEVGNSSTLVWKVDVNNPLVIDGHAIASYSVGVAPWQP
jgi:hypothetical protein